jgi:hypothetical protein
VCLSLILPAGLWMEQVPSLTPDDLAEVVVENVLGNRPALRLAGTLKLAQAFDRAMEAPPKGLALHQQDRAVPPLDCFVDSLSHGKQVAPATPALASAAPALAAPAQRPPPHL